jgi:hypothetical protein
MIDLAVLGVLPKRAAGPYAAAAERCEILSISMPK